MVSKFKETNKSINIAKDLKYKKILSQIDR